MQKIDYPEDCLRIRNVLFVHGYIASFTECEELWAEYSNDLCAGWIFLPEEDDDIWRILEDYVLKKMAK